MEELLKKIISLDKADRVKLARMVRMNTQVWNAVHGLGNIPERLEKGAIEGLVTRDSQLEEGVRIIARRIDLAESVVLDGGIEIVPSEIIEKAALAESELLVEATTDSNGYYKLELPVGKYDISFEKEGTTPILIESIPIATSFIDTKNASLVKSK